MNWTTGTNFTLSNQSDICTPTQTNVEYHKLALEFVGKYMASSFFNLNCADIYYLPDSLLSLAIIKNNQTELHEFKGYTLFREKMANLGVTSIKYTDTNIVSQPVESNAIIVSVHGKGEINNLSYTISNTLFIKIVDGSAKIVNHLFKIFS